MQIRLAVAVASLALLLNLPAGAGELRQHPKAVLELFTSQGCSSCPAADKLLTELGERPEVIALAYHVDYWDYIGWPDTFGAAANSDHQRAYAASWGSSRIFTPQLIVNGTAGVAGSRRSEVGKALSTAALDLPVRLKYSGDMLEVSIGSQHGLEEAMVWLVTFIDRAEVTVERGENEGKKLAYTQIVTGRQVLGMWEPDRGAQMKLPLSEVLGEAADGAAILVQQEQNGLPGRILGAASFQR
ncbi:MAG TPA: DUF1223 domain-containing protein [Devosiaceae bacterium]|jgi:hypothetical protein|nr:DUF1223 domain-containing protein [Devosiaceae bacterium]